jgi:hypothetical protein
MQTFGNLVGSHLVGRKGVAEQLRDLAAQFHSASFAPMSEPSLVRDPDNAYHSNAIHILFNGEKIGFVEREVADRLAPLLDRGIPITASFYSFADAKRPLIEFEWPDA